LLHGLFYSTYVNTQRLQACNIGIDNPELWVCLCTVGYTSPDPEIGLHILSLVYLFHILDPTI